MRYNFATSNSSEKMVNLNAGGMAVALPYGFEIDFVRIRQNVLRKCLKILIFVFHKKSKSYVGCIFFDTEIQIVAMLKNAPRSTFLSILILTQEASLE